MSYLNYPALRWCPSDVVFAGMGAQIRSKQQQLPFAFSRKLCWLLHQSTWKHLQGKAGCLTHTRVYVGIRIAAVFIFVYLSCLCTSVAHNTGASTLPHPTDPAGGEPGRPQPGSRTREVSWAWVQESECHWSWMIVAWLQPEAQGCFRNWLMAQAFVSCHHRTANNFMWT